MVVALGVAIVVVAGLFGLWLNRNWYKSSWRIDQITSIDRLDRLINRVTELVADPDSGLNPAEIGDLKGDWRPIRAELARGYSVQAWWQNGRVSHTLEDRRVQALWTLAVKGAKPLLHKLSQHNGGRLPEATINEIFDVLSTDLDALASNDVTTKTVQSMVESFSVSS